jgi:hypothetical protein
MTQYRTESANAYIDTLKNADDYLNNLLYK